MIDTQLMDEVKALPWVHTIDLGNGVVTPGVWPPNRLILQAFDQIDFAGKRVLDIGCWDGLWSFEAEKRGATEVYATDDISQRDFHSTRTFALAKDALHSHVRYFPETPIEQISGLGVKFDIVLFLGVYYHLRDPLRALGILRSVLNDGGLIVVEGAVCYNLRRAFALFLYSDIRNNDRSNWWIPSVKCLEEWIESSFFHKQSTYLYSNTGIYTRTSRLVYAARRAIGIVIPQQNFGRAVVVAQAYSGPDPRRAFPDPLFAGIDKNSYT
jgi:tRNA (mo5U34)-methyltransferase